MSKEKIDQEAIEEFFNENPNVFSSVLRNMKGKTKKSYKKLPSINQTRKTNRDYKKKKKLSPIKEDEEEKEKSKEKVCLGCLQSGGMEDNKKRQRTGSFETFMDRHPMAMPLPRCRPEVVIPLPEEDSQDDRQARHDRMMSPGPFGDPTHMTRISRNPPTSATAARVLDPSDLSNYYQDPNDGRIDRYNLRQNNLKYRIAVQNYYSNPDNPFPKNIREWRQIINDLAIQVRDDENDSENNHLLNALRKVRPAFTGRSRDLGNGNILLSTNFETRDDFLNNNRREIEYLQDRIRNIDDRELKRLGFQVVPNSAHIGGKRKTRKNKNNKKSGGGGDWGTFDPPENWNENQRRQKQLEKANRQMRNKTIDDLWKRRDKYARERWISDEQYDRMFLENRINYEKKKMEIMKERGASPTYSPLHSSGGSRRITKKKYIYNKKKFTRRK